jgi:hypothetical protein
LTGYREDGAIRRKIIKDYDEIRGGRRSGAKKEVGAGDVSGPDNYIYI